MEGFSREFRTGMSKDYRARLLGDVDRNAPEHWDWGGPGSEPHLLVMFFAEPKTSILLSKAPKVTLGVMHSRR